LSPAFEPVQVAEGRQQALLDRVFCIFGVTKQSESGTKEALLLRSENVAQPFAITLALRKG